MTSDQVFKSQFLSRGLHIQHFCHCARFECSSFSSLANTRVAKKAPLVLQGTKNLGGIGLIHLRTRDKNRTMNLTVRPACYSTIICICSFILFEIFVVYQFSEL